MPLKPTYADRVIFHMCQRGPSAFEHEEFVEDVIQEMVSNGEAVTRVSRACIKRHLRYLRRTKLLIKDHTHPEKLRPHAKLAAELDRIGRNLDFSPALLKKNGSLVRIGVYPRKRITMKELDERYIELLDERDALEVRCRELQDTSDEVCGERDELRNLCQELRDERDLLQDSCEELREERDALQQRCDALQKTCNDLEQKHHDLEEQLAMMKDDVRYVREEQGFMDVNDGEDITSCFPSPPPLQRQHTGASLRRTPTQPVIPPTTPVRNASFGLNQSLPTPPDSDRRAGRLSRTGSRAQRSFRNFTEDNGDDVPMDASGSFDRAPFQNVSTNEPGHSEPDSTDDQFAVNRRDMARQIDALEQATQQREQDSAHYQELVQKTQGMQKEADYLRRQVEERERELAKYEARRHEQAQRYAELQQRETDIRARADALQREIQLFINANAVVLTLANTRIREQTEELISTWDTLHGVLFKLRPVAAIFGGVLGAVPNIFNLGLNN